MQVKNKWIIDKKTTAGFGLALFILASISTASYFHFLSFRKSSYWVKHTLEVLKLNEELLTLLTDAETGQRGYLLTGSNHYLQPYRIAISRIDQKIKQLQQLTSDNSNQQRRLNAVKPLISAKLVELKQTIEWRQHKGMDSALQVVKTDRGQQLMQDIRKLLGEVATEENKLLQERSQQEQTNAEIRLVANLVNSIVAFILTIFAMTVVNRELSLRIQGQAVLKQALEQLEAEHSLKQATLARLEAVLQQMPAGVVIAEAPSGKLVLGNQQVEQIWRHPFLASEDINKYDSWKGFHTDGQPYQPEEWPLARSIINGEVVIEEEIEFLRGDSTRGVLSVNSAPIRNSQGTISAGVAVFSDITWRKLAEEDRRKQIEQERLVAQLEKLNQLKDDFLSTVSHELRTPMSNIKMAIEMLKVSLESPERSRRYLEILQTECTREIELLNDLLDLQRLETASFPVLLFEAVSLQDLLPVIVEPFRVRMQEFQQIQIHLPPDLPLLVSNRFIVERILAELLNNACKYTPTGGEIVISVRYNPSSPASLPPTSGTTIFTISNTTEIPTAELSRIFDKFYRVPNSDRWKQGGTGLGLALVKKLVENLHGSIQVESGGGWTSFTVSLPNQLTN